MKIIDFNRRGNVVRFYLGRDDENDYYGDDWDDRPYEHNAGTVYQEFVYATVDVAMDYDGAFTEPADDWSYNGNSPFCKDNFKEGLAPCLLAVSKDVCKQYWEVQYSAMVANQNVLKIYYNQKWNDEFVNTLKEAGVTVLKYTERTKENTGDCDQK